MARSDSPEVLFDLIATESEGGGSPVRTNRRLPRLPQSIQDEPDFFWRQGGVDLDRGVTGQTGRDSSFRLGDRGSRAVLLSFGKRRSDQLARVETGERRGNGADDVALATEVLDVESIQLNPGYLFLQRDLLGRGKL